MAPIRIGGCYQRAKHFGLQYNNDLKRVTAHREFAFRLDTDGMRDTSNFGAAAVR